MAASEQSYNLPQVETVKSYSITGIEDETHQRLILTVTNIETKTTKNTLMACSITAMELAGFLNVRTYFKKFVAFGTWTCLDLFQCEQ